MFLIHRRSKFERWDLGRPPVATWRDVIGYHGNQNFFFQNWKIFVPIDRAWNKVSKKGHNLYLKMNTSGNIKQIRLDDVINNDVIKKLKIVKIQKFLFHSIENHLRNKKYYYETVWISICKEICRIDDFAWAALEAWLTGSSLFRQE